MKKKLISAKEVVKKFNTSLQKINNYTTLGLLEVVAKNKNTRMYDEAKVGQRLAAVTKLLKEGYTLRLIRKKLEEGQV